MVDQAVRHGLRDFRADRRDQNLTGTNAAQAVRIFVNPEKGTLEAAAHRRIYRLDVRIPALQGLLLELSPTGTGRSNEQTCAHEADQKPMRYTVHVNSILELDHCIRDSSYFAPEGEVYTSDILEVVLAGGVAALMAKAGQ
jgi:hypothetical protein